MQAALLIQLREIHRVLHRDRDWLGSGNTATREELRSSIERLISQPSVSRRERSKALPTPDFEHNDRTPTTARRKHLGKQSDDELSDDEENDEQTTAADADGVHRHFEPFLNMISSVEANANLTASALTSVAGLLAVLAKSPRLLQTADLLTAVARALVSCRFESAEDAGANEVVWSRMVECALLLIRVPCAGSLSPSLLVELFLACFRLSYTHRLSKLLRIKSLYDCVTFIDLLFAPPSSGAAARCCRAEFSEEARIELFSCLTTPEELSELASIYLLTHIVEYHSAAIARSPQLSDLLRSRALRFLLSSLHSYVHQSQPHRIHLTLANKASGATTTNAAAALASTASEYPETLVSILTALVTIFSNQQLRPGLYLQLHTFVRLLIRSVGTSNSSAAASEPPSAPSSSAFRRIFLNTLLQLCRSKDLVLELFLNFDCMLELDDLYENVCQVLYANAVPEATHPVLDSHVACFEGLVAVIRELSSAYLNRAQAIGNGSTAEGQHGHHNDDNGDEQEAQFQRERRVLPLLEPDEQAALRQHDRFPRLVKALKRQIQSVVAAFNRKPAEGIAALESTDLLSHYYHQRPHDDGRESEEVDATKRKEEAIARFLRRTPALDKVLIGEYIGSSKQVGVLKAYCGTFDFEAPFEDCVRQFLQSFRLPGESALIERVMENFAERYFSIARDRGPFRSQDAVFIFSYAIILLNVDLHNPLVKQKMTFPQFVRNNSGYNGDDKGNLPEGFLRAIYDSVQRTQIQLDESLTSPFAAESNTSWENLLRNSQRYQRSYLSARHWLAAEQEMFLVVWKPTISALSLLFDQLDDLALIDGYHLCALVASLYNNHHLIDNLVITLAKLSSLLSSRQISQLLPALSASSSFLSSSSSSSSSSHLSSASAASLPQSSSSASTVSASASKKAHLAARTLFGIVRKHADHIREGWGTILRCLLNLFGHQFFPVSAILPVHEFFDFTPSVEAEEACHQAAQAAQSLSSSGGGSLLGGLFDWWGGRTPPVQTQQATTAAAALAAASSSYDSESSLSRKEFGVLTGNGSTQFFKNEAVRQFVRDCQIAELVADCQAMQLDSLVYLIKALILASVSDRQPRSFENPRNRSLWSENCSVFCLQLLCNVAILNRERIVYVWVLVTEHLCNVIASHATQHVSVVAAAIGCVFELCSELFTEVTIRAELTASLLFLHTTVPPPIFNRFASNFASALESILHTNMTAQSPQFWTTLCLLLVDTAQGGAPDRVVDIVAQTLKNLEQSPQNNNKNNNNYNAANSFAQEILVETLLTLTNVCPLRAFTEIDQLFAARQELCTKGILTKICSMIASSSSLLPTRKRAFSLLQSAVLSTHSPTSDLCSSYLLDVLLPLANDLLPSSSTTTGHQVDEALEEILLRAFGLLIKAFLQYLPYITSPPTRFDGLWLQVLQTSERIHSVSASDASKEAIQETLKNLVLVVLTSSALTSSTRLWTDTWLILGGFSALSQDEQICTLIKEIAELIPEEQ